MSAKKDAVEIGPSSNLERKKAMRGPRSLKNLLDSFEKRRSELRESQRHFSEEEMRLHRAALVLKRAGAASECGYVFFRPDIADHIESLAWEISCSLWSDEIPALAINPLVLYMQNYRLTHKLVE